MIAKLKSDLNHTLQSTGLPNHHIFLFQKMEQHNVIYSIGCNNCSGQYIGQTGQKLKNRVRPHKQDQNSKTKKQNNTAAYHLGRPTGVL